MHPRELPRITGSRAEIQVYESLKSGLPEELVRLAFPQADGEQRDIR